MMLNVAIMNLVKVNPMSNALGKMDRVRMYY